MMLAVSTNNTKHTARKVKAPAIEPVCFNISHPYAVAGTRDKSCSSALLTYLSRLANNARWNPVGLCLREQSCWANPCTPFQASQAETLPAVAASD